MISFRWLTLAVLLLSSLTATAQVVDFSIHNNYISPRAMGMGGAFAAVVDDHSAMFYNPAAIARRKEGVMHFFLRGAIDKSYSDLIDQIDQADNQANDEEAIANVLKANYGNNYYTRLPTLGGFWVRPNWGIAFIPVDLTLDLGLHQQIGPSISLNAYHDSTLAYSYARNVKWGQSGDLSVGATVKLINRLQASEAVGIEKLAADEEIFNEQSAREGLFLDLDVGFLWTPKIPKKGWLSALQYSKPSFALVMRNLGDPGPITNLHIVNEESSDALNMQRRIDLGAKFQLPRFWVFDPKFAWDIRNILHENWTFAKGNHVGFEMGWEMFSWWKGYWSFGLNQWGFDGDFDQFTLGFGALFSWFQLEVATWNEDVGTDDIDIKSRRIMVELSVDF